MGLNEQNQHFAELKQNVYLYIQGNLDIHEGPLYDGFLHITDDMLGPSPMHIKYLSYVYDGFCI